MTTTTAYQNVNWSSANTFQDFLVKTNESGANWLFTGIDVMVTMVLFITLAGAFGWEAAIMSSGFIGIVLSLLFVYMGVMSMTTAGIYVGLLLMMIAYVIWSNKYD